MQKQPVIDRSIWFICKDQNPRFVLFVLFLFLKTHKLKISCQLEDLCKEQSHEGSAIIYRIMYIVICCGHIGYLFSPLLGLVSYVFNR